MFSRATANCIRQTDPEGALIPVSRVNDSKKLVLTALVVRRNCIWFWQSPKYRTTDYTLGDLLLGDEVLTPDVTQGEFVTSYKGTYKDSHFGKVEGEGGAGSVTLEGGSTGKLQSCFGELIKEDLDLKKLVRDASNRLVDMQNPLVAPLQKRADVLAMVKERIITTTPCSITQTKNQQCNFRGILKLLGLFQSLKVSVTESNNMELDSDVSLEIPSGTVIAYSIRELEIKKDGHYRICVQPDMIGGIESDSPEDIASAAFFSEVDGKTNGEKVPESELQNGSHDHMVLSSLADLPHQTRWDLFKKLQETLSDRTALSDMESLLEDQCSRSEPDGPGSECYCENSQSDSPAHINAVHLLVSALEELPDQTLNMLSESRPDFIEAFDTLMCSLEQSSECLSVDSLPLLLKDNPSFQQAEQLLSSVCVTLRRDGDRLRTETGDKAGVLPLVLRLSTHGLSLLCRGQN